MPLIINFYYYFSFIRITKKKASKDKRTVLFLFFSFFLLHLPEFFILVLFLLDINLGAATTNVIKTK